MKTLILKKKVKSSKIEINLPPNFKKGEEIVIKIKKIKPLSILKLQGIAQKYDNPKKDYKELIYDYIAEKGKYL